MDRREFLITSGSLLTGSLFGLGTLSNAFACGSSAKNSVPRVALIIDDIGYSVLRARQFLDLQAPLTFSILPRLPRSKDLAQEIHERGRQIMLHQPMEPFNGGLDPGPGALYVGYDAERIDGILEENIQQIPFAKGINNHMGSRFTASARDIRITLNAVAKSGLFFVDSLTSGRSVAYGTARRLHVPSGCRSVFLDNRRDESRILTQYRRLVKCARRHGHAIGIGHPFPETVRAIRKALKDPVLSQAYSLVNASELMRISSL
jgi:hypothetical protein